jgi:antitoxin CptB
MRAALSADDAQIELDWRRLRWRCRRGMKELDIILERYARRAHAEASPAERCAFAALLELPDPELAGYLFGHDAPSDPQLARLARRIGCGAFATGGGG